MRTDVSKFLSWAGWAVIACAIVAAVVVVHALTRPPHRPEAEVAQALPTGATLDSVDGPDGPHLIVSSLQTAGPGDAAGLRVGDEIEDVDGLPAPTLGAFNKDVASGSYQVVDLRIRRGHQLLDIHLPRHPGTAA
jgi:S1-C subfamily serine protease